MNRTTIRLVTIVICLLILASGGWNAVTLSSQGYSTGYEGAKATFYGLDWTYQDGTSGRETFSLKGTTFNFDKDGPTSRRWAPNLVGEMTAVFIPERSNPIPTSWGFDIRNWWDTATRYINNPVHHYEWEIHDEEKNETRLYAMDEYNLKWYFSISADWDAKQGGDKHWQAEYHDKRYSDTKVWFEFDIAPIWYFEGADTTYFSIAELRISEIAFGRLKDHERTDDTEATGSCRVAPASPTSILYIYHNPYGDESQRAEIEPYEVEGKKLNPELFRDKVYSFFTLVNFGTDFWSEFGGPPFGSYHWRGDVVTVGLDVLVFVVGEWKVKDIQEIPETYGRTAQTGGTSGLLDFLSRLWNNPSFRTWFILGIIALIFLILALFAPWVLFALFGMVKSLRGTKKKGKG